MKSILYTEQVSNLRGPACIGKAFNRTKPEPLIIQLSSERMRKRNLIDKAASLRLYGGPFCMPQVHAIESIKQSEIYCDLCPQSI